MVEGMMLRVGRWCFRHRWSVAAVWVVAAVAGGFASTRVSKSLTDSAVPHHVESIEGRDVVTSASGTGGEILALVDGVDPQDQRVRLAVTIAARELADRGDVRGVTTPYASSTGSAAGAYVSGDRQALLIVVALAELDQRDQNSAIDEITARLHRLNDELHAAGVARSRVRVGGELAFARQAILAEDEDLTRGELVSLPITFVVLVVVFGGLVAAGIPLFAAVVSVASAMTLLLGFLAVTDLGSNAVTVLTVLGLALSVDYSMLLVARYREELAAGHPPDAAVGRAWATAGRTVAFSALTVAAAIAGLLAFGLPGLSTLGAAGVSIAVVAMLAALTFTAATLGLTRRWIKPARRARHGGPDGEGGFFARLARLVQRRPVLVVSTSTVLLLLAGTPLLTTTFKLPGLTLMPSGTEAREVAEDLAGRFDGVHVPAVTVVARADPVTLDDWSARWRADPVVARMRPAEQLSGGLARLEVDVTGDPQGQAVQDLVRRMRADRPSAGQSWVTGDAAVLVDTLGLVERDLPKAIFLTLGAMVLLLFLMTGSLVVPVKAILASAVSLGATFGVMSAVFARGWLAGPLDTLTVGGLDPFIVVIVFAFAFGLSIDYEVFLLGRIKEYVDRGHDTETAVRRGLQHTGHIITSAALVMLIIFVSFAGARMGEIEQIGVGLTVAVLVDATVVRCLLVPAAMTLLGRWNWWAPAPLRRLHGRLGLQGRSLSVAERDDDARTTSQPSTTQ